MKVLRRCLFISLAIMMCFALDIVSVQGHVSSRPASLITTNAVGWGSPASTGKIVIWARARTSRTYAWGTFVSLWAKDLQTGREFRVADPIALASLPVASDQFVAWEDCRRCVTGRGLPGFAKAGIRVKSLTANREFELSTKGQVESAPAISGNTLVWIEHMGSSVSVKGENLFSGREFTVAINSNMKADAVVAGSTVAWAEMQNGGWNIVTMNTSNGQRFVVARHNDTSYFTGPVIRGSRLIWTAWNSDDSVSIRGIDLLRKRRFQVVTIQRNHFNPEIGPTKAISKTSVYWNQTQAPLSSRGAHFTIYGRNLITNRLFVVEQNSADQLNPSVGSKTLAWFTKRGHGYLHGSVYVTSVP